MVSHAVGVIAMQAAAAQVSWPSDPDTALEALDTIDQTASHALADLDRVLPDGTAEAHHDLDALVDRIRATGTDVALIRRGTATVDAVLYRIVQEGLTNAVRHAPGAPVEVVIDATGDGVRARVADDGPGPRPARPAASDSSASPSGSSSRAARCAPGRDPTGAGTCWRRRCPGERPR